MLTTVIILNQGEIWLSFFCVRDFERLYLKNEKSPFLWAYFWWNNGATALKKQSGGLLLAQSGRKL